MKRWIHGLSMAAAAMLLLGLPASSAQAVIINLDSRVSATAPIELFLEAGRYSVQPIGTARGGGFDAWSAWGATTCAALSGCPRTRPTTFTGWLNLFNVESDELVAVNVDGLALSSVATPPSAIGSFWLMSASESFYRVDDGAVYANPSSALTGALSSTFTLGSASSVLFRIPDTPLSDNRGGLSLRLERVSTTLFEPAAFALLCVGIVMMQIVRRYKPTPTRR